MVQHRLQLLHIQQPQSRLETLDHLTQQRAPVCRQCNWALGVHDELKRFLHAPRIDLTLTYYREHLDTSSINPYTQASRFRKYWSRAESFSDCFKPLWLPHQCLCKNYSWTQSVSRNDRVHIYPPAKIRASWAEKEEKTVLRIMVSVAQNNDTSTVRNCWN